MTLQEKLRLVDLGADNYLRIIASAPHMRITDNGRYETMCATGDINDLCSIYNIRLEALDDDMLHKTLGEIRAQGGGHIWWPLAMSERVAQARFGGGPRPRLGDGDFEMYALVTPEGLPAVAERPEGLDITLADTPEAFAAWCTLNNAHEHGSTVVLHPEGHFPLVQSGQIRCFLGSVNGKPVATCAILTGEGTTSLEFVCTQPTYRRKGVARAMCQYALADAFARDAQPVSIRAIGDGTALGRALGLAYLLTEL